MEFIKKNFVVLLAFALPVLLIGGVFLSMYLPSLFLTTNYNFVYTSCDGDANYYYYNCNNYLQNRYTVVNGVISANVVEDTFLDQNQNGIIDAEEKFTARIFLHDTEKNESREITIEEAQALKLNGLLTSPDGVSVSSHYNRGGDFFIFGGGSSSYGQYLTKGNSRTRLNLINSSDRYYYQSNFQFIGWVLPGRN